MGVQRVSMPATIATPVAVGLSPAVVLGDKQARIVDCQGAMNEALLRHGCQVTVINGQPQVTMARLEDMSRPDAARCVAGAQKKIIHALQAHHCKVIVQNNRPVVTVAEES